MNNSLEKAMKSASKVFRKYALDKEYNSETADVLSEHYPMLQRCSKKAEKDCRKHQKRMKDPDILPGLFGKCSEMCKGGVLPDSDGIIEFFDDGLNGIQTYFLPLAITCVLLKKCADSVVSDNCQELKNSVLSLQKMRDTDFDYISEMLFKAEKSLLSDPTDIYSYMEKESKKAYRKRITYLALKSQKTEADIAKEILEKSKKSNVHIGTYLYDEMKSTKRGTAFILLEAFLPAMICFSAGVLSGEWLVSALLYFPLWMILKRPIESASVKGVKPKKFLSLDPECDKVTECNVLITVTAILPSADKIPELKNKLENLYLSNAVGNFKVCCLGDFKSADAPKKPEDKHIINALSNAIEELNKKYSGGFIVAVRPRSYSETQNEFIGKERKRGAITELIRAIKGNKKGFMLLEGDVDGIEKTKYLITLDYDSVPVFDSVKKLVAVAEHPINKPIIKNGKVVSGYGILAPKTQNSLSSATKTFFSSVMSQNPGVLYYDTVSSERYQDLFGESIFCGKGLINVDAYYEILDKGLPRERILSHDILEGEFLRTGFVSDVQITEDFPSDIESYSKRLHRWVRGDWQNAFFIFGKNKLKSLSRYKLFDNLRRSLTPIICIAVILYSAFNPSYSGMIAAVISAYALCASDIFSAASSVVHSGISSVTGLYYSKRLPEGLACLARAFFSVAFSAKEAFVCLDAILKSLWRCLVSRDNLLEWSAFASEEHDNAVKIPLLCLPALIVSGVLIGFGVPLHRMLGLLILGDIPLTLFSGLKLKQRKTVVTDSQKDFLISQAASIWDYFVDFCGEENNFLPPDNVQYAPHRELARRTSPTNIGLMLASFVAARDFGFITSDELYNRLEKSLKSIEKLEKYKGNLLNWYSTETLETLNPRFVSAVDSGNFLCCLTAVKEGLREYSNECKELEETSKKIENIISSTDLSVMYNDHRKLFCIGINPDNGEKTESCYDLYMSEIRMTAYFAVSSKKIPINHWSALDRPLIKDGRHAGLASWTGTMFEYFMSDIFLPSPYGSMSDEALCFCFQSQRKIAGKNPFGISESAFYAFDADLNYQYKAHGVQKLGLQRGLDKEKVISPYSSFLTLNIAPQLSIKNLKKLQELGLQGKYGFYESVDFTKSRNKKGFSIINSFMVHHLAMSFLSADNLLNNKAMQRRFMNDRFMKGAESLLEEKPPIGKEIFKDVAYNSKIPTVREKTSPNTGSLIYPDKNSPEYIIFSNSRMSLCISNMGQMQVILDGEKIFSEKSITDYLEADGKKYYFCNNSKARIHNNEIEFMAEYDELILKLKIYLIKSCNCIIKKYCVRSRKKETVKGKIVVNCKNCKEGNCYIASGFLNKTSDNNEIFTEEIEFNSESEELIFVIAAENTQQDAEESFESLKTSKEHKKAFSPFEKDSFQSVIFKKYFSKIIQYDNGINLNEIDISNEYPVIFVETNSLNAVNLVKPFIQFNKNLRNLGIGNTLVISNNAPESEKNAALQTIEKFLSEEECVLMKGIAGGVYIIEENSYKKSDYERLKKCSAVQIQIKDI